MIDIMGMTDEKRRGTDDSSGRGGVTA